MAPRTTTDSPCLYRIPPRAAQSSAAKPIRNQNTPPVRSQDPWAFGLRSSQRFQEPPTSWLVRRGPERLDLLVELLGELGNFGLEIPSIPSVRMSPSTFRVEAPRTQAFAETAPGPAPSDIGARGASRGSSSPAQLRDLKRDLVSSAVPTSLPVAVAAVHPLPVGGPCRPHRPPPWPGPGRTCGPSPAAGRNRPPRAVSGATREVHRGVPTTPPFRTVLSVSERMGRWSPTSSTDRGCLVHHVSRPSAGTTHGKSGAHLPMGLGYLCRQHGLFLP